MDSTNLQEMRDRVAALEQANRRMLYAFATLGLVLVGFMGGSTRFGRPADRLSAEQFVLTDRAGEARATLGLLDGQPALTLLDERGRLQVQLAARADHSAALDFLDGDQVRLAITSSAQGASVQMIGRRNELSAALYSWSSGPSGLAFNRGLGGLRLAVESDGGSQIGFADGQGHTRAGWEVNRRGSMRPLGQALPGLSLLGLGGSLSGSARANHVPTAPAEGTADSPGGGTSRLLPSRPALAP